MSKRSSGEKDAFDKQAEELSAMLAESRRWLADVEAAEASSRGREVVVVPPPARDEEQLHGAVSPRLALQQDETARDLAAVQEKQELEEAIERAQQEMQQLMQLQNAAALQQSDTGDVQAPNGTPLDVVQLAAAAVVSEMVDAVAAPNSTTLNVVQSATTAVMTEMVGAVAANAVGEAATGNPGAGAKGKVKSLPPTPGPDVDAQERRLVQTLGKVHAQTRAQNSVRSGQVPTMRTGSGSSTGSRELMPPPEGFEATVHKKRKSAGVRTRRTAQLVSGGSKRLLIEPPSTLWGGGIGSWRQMQLPRTNRNSPESMSAESIRATREERAERPRQLSTDLSRPTSLQPVLAAAGPPRVSAQSKALQSEVSKLLESPLAVGSPAGANTVKADDWDRLRQESFELLAENAQLRRSLGDLSVSRKEMQNHISRIVELEEENTCLKADVDRLTMDNNVLRDVAKGMRDMRNERLARAENRLQGLSPPPVDDNEIKRLRHENEKVRNSWEQARKAQAALEDELADLRATLRRDARQHDHSQDALITLVLNTDFKRAGADGSKEREDFKAVLLQDLSHAAGIPSSDFQVTDIRGGSIVIDIAICKGETCHAPMTVARDLERQAYAPASRLCTGVLTRDLEVIMVSGADQPPVDASQNEGLAGKMEALEKERDRLNSSLLAEADKRKMLEEDLAMCRKEWSARGEQLTKLQNEYNRMQQDLASSQTQLGFRNAEPVAPDLKRCKELTLLVKDYVDKDHFAQHHSITENRPGGNRSTIGLSYEDKNCTITGILAGGPAFNTKKMNKGDILVAIDNTVCAGNEKRIGELLLGNDQPGSVCILRIQSVASGQIEDIALQREAVEKLADKRAMFDLITRITDRLKKDQDTEGVNYAEQVLDLWNQMMQEEQEQDDACIKNIHQMQEQCDAWLDQLYKELEDKESTRRGDSSEEPEVTLKNADVDAFRAENAALLRKLADRDAEIAQCNAECNTELREMLKQVGEAQQEARASNEEVNRLKSQLQENADRIEKYSTSQELRQEMEKKLVEAQLQIRDLERKNSELETAMQSLPKGKIGMKISSDPPHKVLSVTELISQNGENMNHAVQIGDELCEIDGVRVETLPVETVLLQVAGPAGTLLRMGLKHHETGEKYNIVLLRHLQVGRSASNQESPPRGATGNSAELAEKLIEHERKVVELSDELRKTMEHNGTVIAQLNSEHDREMREMLEQVGEAKQEDRATISALQGQVDQLSELLAQSKTEVTATEGTSTVVSTLTGEIQKLQRELGEKTEQTGKLHTELHHKLGKVESEKVQLQERLAAKEQENQELQGALDEAAKKCEEAEVALDQESNETAKLLETLKGKGGEVANRLAEVQELLETKTKELQNKDQELQQKQLQVEAVLKRLDDCSQEILAMREKQRDSAEEQQNLKSELGRQIEERETLQSQLHAKQQEEQRARDMAITLKNVQRENNELQIAMSRKHALETEQAAKIVDLQRALSRMQTSEQELTAKVSQLQGSIDREKIHQQLVRGSQEDHDQAREQVLVEDKTARDDLERQLAAADEAKQHLQMKIYLLTDAANSASLKAQESTADATLAYEKVARLEQELMSYRKREADARALVEQMNAESGSESDPLGASSRQLLPTSPIDSETISALERELLSDALKGSNKITGFSGLVHPDIDAFQMRNDPIHVPPTTAYWERTADAIGHHHSEQEHHPLRPAASIHSDSGFDDNMSLDI